MGLCKKHPHSSDETARKCYEKLIAKQANRKLANVAMEPNVYVQVKCDPPEPVKLANVTVYYFFKGVEKKYALPGPKGYVG